LFRESSARTKIARLMADKLVSKVGDKKQQNGIVRTLYRKTGNVFLSNLIVSAASLQECFILPCHMRDWHLI